jgi:hypothetical protein
MNPRRTVCLLVLVMLAAVESPALETDQYYAWGRPLADSTEAVNAKFNLELQRAIANFPADKPPPTCRQISIAYRKRMRFVLLHEIQIWAWNSSYVDRIPNGAEAQRDYRRTSLYSNHPLIDTGTWMPFTPTLEVAGVRFGTDKLAHLVSSGWTYYKEYNRGLRKGETPDEAKRRAANRGITEESLILGKLASGVLAIGDLEANLSGMHLYLDLCDVPDPILALGEDGWVISRPVDLGDYVTPRWDESYQPPIYTRSRWRKVQPVLETYCGKLSDPQVISMRRRYREMDRGSLVGDLIAERVEEGRLVDPAQFGLEAVCSGADFPHRPAAVPVTFADNAGQEAGRAPTPEDIAAEEADRRRFALGLVGLHVTYPQVASATLGVMATSQPGSFDCRTPCDFRGFIAALGPGLGGVKVSLGWARVTGNTNRSGSFLKAGFIGAAFKATVLRTWGDLGWVEGGRTYAGLEFGLPVAQASVGLGLLYRVDDGSGGRWLVTGGAGWGF